MSNRKLSRCCLQILYLKSSRQSIFEACFGQRRRQICLCKVKKKFPSVISSAMLTKLIVKNDDDKEKREGTKLCHISEYHSQLPPKDINATEADSKLLCSSAYLSRKLRFDSDELLLNFLHFLA